MKYWLLAALAPAMMLGQGLNNGPVNWGLPNGGRLSGSSTYGFATAANSAANSDDTGSQTWGLTDMDGDHRPDLVVFAQLQGGKVTCFGPGNTPYWKVYHNDGNGFSSTPINWGLPLGGKLIGGTIFGFDNSSGTALNADDTGSQSWGLLDANSDGRPDLVVTAQKQAGIVTCFAPGNNPYWKVYYNTGNGFSMNSVNWSLPNGGKILNGDNLGFNALSGIASVSDDTGSQNWSIADLNGDGKMELVVTAQLQGGNVTSFAPTSGQYWKVYSNIGSGFDVNSTNWSLPQGGRIASDNTTLGFDLTAGTSSDGNGTGSQNWALIDLNHDGKSDLVVMGQKQGGKVTIFSPLNNHYWKLYINSGSGFATTETNFGIPDGGKIDSDGTLRGFNNVSGAASSNENTGSQSWSVMDITGDNIPEIVVHAQLQGGNVTSFSPSSNQYWKVFAHTSTGYSATPINCALPDGGKISSSNTLGFFSAAGFASTFDGTGSQNWVVMDMNGDSRPDMVVTGQLQGGNVTSFAPTTTQYWKVYTGKIETGIVNHELNATLNIFPNPASGHVNIAGPGGHYELYDVTGRFVRSFDKGIENVTIDKLSAGIYIIRNGEQTAKLIISN